MHVPLTTRDFIDRAELALRREPGDRRRAGRRPAASAADLRRARRACARLRGRARRAGHRRRRAGRDRLAELRALHGRAVRRDATGRILVPVNFRLKPHEVRFIVEHSGAELLLVDPELDEALGELPVKHRIVLDGVADAELFAGATASPAPWEPDEDAIGTINYTSGTTSDPKGVLLTHRSLWLNAVTFGWHIGLSDRDVYLHTLPQFHGNGWGMPLAATAMGMRAGDPAQDRRRGDPAADRAPRRDRLLRCADRDQRDPRRRRGAQRARRAASRARARCARVVAGSPPPSAVSSASRSCSAGSSTRSTG